MLDAGAWGLALGYAAASVAAGFAARSAWPPRWCGGSGCRVSAEHASLAAVV